VKEPETKAQESYEPHFTTFTGSPFGSRIRSDESSQNLLSRRLATPLFTAGMLSSVTYVPQFLLMALAVTGAATGWIGLWTGLAVVVIVALAVGAQFVVIKNYPGGGGDYQVAKHNLGHRTAATVASGFMVDYALTVALCLGMAVHMFSGVLPELMPYATWVVVALLAIIFLVALRGFAHSAWFTLIPTIFLREFSSHCWLLLLPRLLWETPLLPVSHLRIDPQQNLPKRF